ncbi:site-specific DNA-methyltransferase [Vagococcus sp. CY53-2]|uniref:DNA methyltransferase n=1 Tax=Vagococcus sp. CY53-2 TaxID=2925780 RepID=UPI001F5056A0|nr:site-specific DNA-methyltransferase [Vagococcus sp. CY53-2]MCI0130031.1 site-specific DNA-methyltransferase [Vagococcus sp. CY53-2]
MIETVLLKEIKNVLSQFANYWDNEILLKNRVSEDLRSYESELITALLSNESIKKQFEVSINGTSIFKIEEFIQMLTYKGFWEDSYTKYSNKIGLTTNGKYLDYNSDVVLDFPFKDCILEGRMTKEEVGKKEIYYNKVIARDEVDTLLSPKVFTNTKKYTKVDEEEISEISDTDNLIIKGNNLLALHSLKEKYSNKIKFIYIDPPYNTKSDSFRYNDSFNHSSWLTFIKNRVEIAKDLLSVEGLIAIHCDDNEIGYINVLLDEVLGKENLISIFPRITKRGGKSTEVVAKNHDYVFLYSIDKNLKKLYPVEHNDADFKYKDEYFEERGYYKLNQTLDYDSLQYNKSLDYPIEIQGHKLVPGGDWSKFKSRESGEFNRADWAWRWSKELYNFGLTNGFIELKTSGARPRIYTKTYQKVKIEKINGVYEIVSQLRTKPLSTLEFTDNLYSNDNATKHATKLFEKGMFDYTKPETVIKKLLEITTKEGDIVLDFFMGSATTQAVAMKMNRQFIGIEQMDYINSVSVPRLQKVMEGEQGGISKDVNWQGGGSFIYTELMDLNNKFVKDIQGASSSEELLGILEEIKTYADLNYLVELEKLTNEPIIIDEDTKETLSFEELPLEKQRELLIDVMDINQLYVNYSEIDDDELVVSDEDKAFNHSFYEAGDN